MFSSDCDCKNKCSTTLSHDMYVMVSPSLSPPPHFIPCIPFPYSLKSFPSILLHLLNAVILSNSHCIPILFIPFVCFSASFFFTLSSLKYVSPHISEIEMNLILISYLTLYVPAVFGAQICVCVCVKVREN